MERYEEKMNNISEDEWERIFQLRDGFVKQITGRTLYRYQKKFSNKIIRSALNNTGETIVSEWTRQCGKTTSVTDTVAFLLMFYFILCEKFKIITTKKYNIGFFAPQIEQSRTAFNMLRDFLKQCEGKGFEFKFDTFNGTTINIVSEKYPPRSVYCFTASPTSKQESKTLNLIIYDESQELIDKVVDKAISPMGASTNAPEIFIGVGGYRKCRFLDLLDKLPAENKIIIPYTKVLEEREELYKKTGDDTHLNYQRHIDKRLREIGEDSDEFKTQYKLIWILERGQFVTYDQLMSLEEEYQIEEAYGRGTVLYGGIDWGKAHDSTVFTIVDESCKIIEWFEWTGDDYASQVEEIMYLIQYKYHGLKVIYCDSTGTQDMAVDILRQKLRSIQHSAKLEDVNFTAKSKDEMFKNLSRLMSDKFVGGNLVQRAIFRFPKKESVNKERFIRELLNLQKEVKNELWRCQAPSGPEFHDDYACSIALACLAFLPRIERGSEYSPSIG